ncbi:MULTISPECIES: 30S ribosomal protein S18 [Aminobacterium]|jgi:small subunit ribosomal protein S18|uniref:Small ribosomal subunit protein bS18 n=1 Tax=Aminobacterium colombiense (strain DSM 12261 / ALA-1) TaxID=572547 RepID=D5EG55_AMICL|nr:MULTISPECIES: 30S ribosomal protein S18 [Aminobacterium]MDD2378941.1 30S ribosomal protein S18 [Aminobacterium colombiense]ADE57537.1 ribosomal protein S18 [Aminobacterium colombiense DSM 12261]MDD3768829.1 30S ribosomal protein S18 [Aminobacterium colombiense]MDD4265140.1 30S ribosomal protein S18 [Aminobacterium colombiense]MDD4585679.1 30S ribosomal protein S18 [Aminobacterium colombiense]
MAVSGGASKGPRAPRRGGKRRPKVCFYCVDKIDYVDYKDVERLRKYISERGKIMPRRVTGNCAKHQRQLTTAIKRARFMALLPYSVD